MMMEILRLAGNKFEKSYGSTRLEPAHPLPTSAQRRQYPAEEVGHFQVGSDMPAHADQVLGDGHVQVLRALSKTHTRETRSKRNGKFFTSGGESSLSLQHG